MTNDTNLDQRAMLVSLSVSKWAARKSDKAITAEVAEKHGNDAAWGNYTKRLVAKDALADINAIANEARRFHYEQTLPWTDAGQRILPAKNFLAYSEQMRDLRARFEAAAADFEAGYPAFVDDARARLNGLFREEDYPAPDAIREKFDFDVAVTPLPAAADFRVSLAAEDVETIRADIEARTARAFEEATRDLWNRAFNTVSRLRDKLTEYTEGKAAGGNPRLHASTVDAIKTLTEILDRLNVTDDAELENVRRAIVDDLTTYDAEDLKEDEAVRAAAVRSADSILDMMAGYTG